MFVVLVHYFWFLEFKFIFEFICLSPFQKISKSFSFSFTFLPFLLCQPNKQSPVDLPNSLVRPRVTLSSAAPTTFPAQHGPQPRPAARWLT
jgi:hypothetical protein